jgi:hypothetical protein
MPFHLLPIDTDLVWTNLNLQLVRNAIPFAANLILTSLGPISTLRKCVMSFPLLSIRY